MILNKYKDIIIEKYNNSDEDSRLTKNRAQNIEYLTTMRYIQKYLKPKAKILEIGAGTGRYSLALAKKGYNVTAIDLTPKHVEIMKQKAKKLKNFQCMQADALDLSMFSDNSFDLVLNFGPLYHLFTPKNKKQSIKETLRLTKRKGISMFAYMPHASIMASYGLRKGHALKLFSAMNKDGKIIDTPKQVFNSFYVEDFKKLFEKTNTKYITNVAVDGIAPALNEWVEQLSSKDYKAFLNWHFMTCERLDQQGFSSHLLYICQKR